MNNYYVSYHFQNNYLAHGEFRELKVKVKGQNFIITHRADYFAD